MSELVRFGVSLDKKLLGEFDSHIRGKKYATRSKALEDLIRSELERKHCEESSDPVAGIIIMVYDHHKRILVNRLLNIQHDSQAMIVCSQHVHLSHSNCLEVIVLKGRPQDIQTLADKLKAEKGVKHLSIKFSSLH